MTYSTTITKKGQITIPKKLRDMLRLGIKRRVILDLVEDKKEIRIKPSYDFLEIAKRIKVKKKIDPVTAREYMAKHYERI